MGLTVSASLNANSNPQIYGANTSQAGSGQPIVANPLSDRVVVDTAASAIVITISKVADKTINSGATTSYNAATLASIVGSSGLTTSNFNGTSFILSGASLSANITAVLRFVFADATFEDHQVYVTRNKMTFSVAQTAATNILSLQYTEFASNTQNPLDDWGVSFNLKSKYEYLLPGESEWAAIATVDILDQANEEFENAYQGLGLRGTRTAYDENNNIIYQSISTTVTYNMSEAVPTPSVTQTDLYCKCGNLDIVDATAYQVRSNWAILVFTRNIVDGTPYYKGAEKGDIGDPLRDSRWPITIPFNGAYTFRWIGVRIYEEATSYGAGDWAYNPIDGKLYVSLDSGNQGNDLSDLTSWRLWNKILDMETVFTKTVNTVSGTYIYASLAKNVTCNESEPVNVRNKKSCDSTCSTIVFEDSTKDFDFARNPYGYGPPNYRKDAYGQAYFLVNPKSDLTYTVAFPKLPHNPTSSPKIYFDIKKDGHYRLYMYQTRIIDGTKFQKNEIGYDEATMAFYKSEVYNNQYPISNTQAWSAVATWEQFRDNPSGYYDDYQWDYLVTCNGEKTLNDIGLGRLSDKCSTCSSDLKEKYDLVSAYLFAAKNAFDVYDYATAQCMLESVPKNCAPYLGGTRTGGCGC